MKKGRFDYIDNLRLYMTILVVLIHLAVTYSGMGGWILTDVKGELDAPCTVIFGLFQCLTQGYFMGAFFFISGFFVVRSYEKKGAGKFLKDRFFRLGIPFLIYVLVIWPFIKTVLLRSVEPSDFFGDYLRYLVSFDFVGCSGPLWFVLALLIFNIIYCLFRAIWKKTPAPSKPLPGVKCSIFCIVLIGICTFLVRLVQPIGTNILNMQLCYFSQYIVLFILGVFWGRYKWYEEISYKMSKRYLMTGLIAGTVTWLVCMVLGGALDGKMDLFMGGMTWQSAIYSLWEGFVGVTVSIGLVGVFREKNQTQTGFVKALSDSSFGVYMFHAPIIVSVSLLLKGVELYPLLKFLLAAVISLPLCFGLTYFVFRRIPLLKKVL